MQILVLIPLPLNLTAFISVVLTRYFIWGLRVRYKGSALLPNTMGTTILAPTSTLLSNDLMMIKNQMVYKNKQVEFLKIQKRPTKAH